MSNTADTPRTDAAKIPVFALRLPRKTDGTYDTSGHIVMAEEMAKLEREFNAANERVKELDGWFRGVQFGEKQLGDFMRENDTLRAELENLRNDFRILEIKRHGELEQIAALDKELEKVKAELADVKAWKESQLKVESEWDAQRVGKLLNLRLGSAIRPQIEPAIVALKAELELARKCVEDLKWLVKNLDITNGTINESVAAYDKFKEGNRDPK